MKKTTLGAMLAAVAAMAFTAAPSQAQHAPAHPLFNAFVCNYGSDDTFAEDGASSVWIQTSPYHVALQLTKTSGDNDCIYVGGYSYLYPTSLQSIQFTFTIAPGSSISPEPLVFFSYVNNGSVDYQLFPIFVTPFWTQTGPNSYSAAFTTGDVGITGATIINQLRLYTDDAAVRYDITSVSVNGHPLTFNSHHTAVTDCNFASPCEEGND